LLVLSAVENKIVANFSDYLVYLDESGDASLTIDENFPLFVLVAVVVKKTDYLASIVPVLQGLKLKYWGHDQLIFHERELRKGEGEFSIFANDPCLKEQFFNELNSKIETMKFHVIYSLIDKKELLKKYREPYSPYDLAVVFLLEKLHVFLKIHQQEGTIQHLVFEARGRKEDNDLKNTLTSRIQGKHRLAPHALDALQWVCQFSTKNSNSTGLQLADLIARPLAQAYRFPQQNNRAYQLIKPKIIDCKHFP